MTPQWNSDIIRPDGENGTEVLDGQGVYQPQIEGGENITIEDGKINASGTLENVQADYTEADPSAPSYIKHKPDLSIYATASGMETELAGKQDVISDLADIRSGAQAGSTAVQPGDLAAVATTGSYTSLSNTPQNIVQDASYVHTDNNFTNADKSKLDGIAAGAEVNVQADWDESDSSSDAYIAHKPTIPAAQVNADWNASSGVAQILNKPDLSAYATDTELSDGLATKQNIISDLDTIRSGAAAGATAAQPSDLPSSDELLPSATSSDAGKILSVDANGSPEWITPSGGTTYSAGDGIGIDGNNVISADVDGVTIGIDSTTKKIKSLQVIPTKTSDLQNDSNFVVASSLATVATSGSYADLSNKPSIPTVDQTYNASSTNAQSGTAVAGAIAGVKQVPASTSADENKVLTVNSSGNPVWEESAVPESKTLVAGSNITITENTNDVTISATDTTYTAGDGIDITNGAISADVDGTTIGIDSSTKKIKLLSTIPAAQVNSDWDASSGVAQILNKPNLATVATTGDYADLSGKPTIPTVDQSYSASSTNAQSGTAVAQAIANKQDTISDLSDIRSGAGLGATSVQDVTVDGTSVVSNGVAAITMPTFTQQQANWNESDSGSVQYIQNKPQNIVQDANYVHTDNNFTNADATKLSGIEANAEVNVQSDWSESDSSSDAYIAHKPNLATVATTGAYSDLSGKPTIPTVDQSYSASSTNAQSGTAVAQAIASIPAASYTAGDGIEITSGEISVDYDTNTLDAVGQSIVESVTSETGYSNFELPASIQSLVAQNDNTQVTVHIPGNTISVGYLSGDPDLRIALLTSIEYPWDVSFLSSSLSYAEVQSEYFLSEQDITFSLPVTVANNWSQQLSSAVAFGICIPGEGLCGISEFGDLTAHPITFSYTDPAKKLTVKNPLPASTSADATKVLTVDSNGAAGWQNVPTPSVDEVPAVTSSDDGKVLKATYSGGQGSYAWDTAPAPASRPIVAGSNITITDNVSNVTIAATNTTYTAGNMMSLSNGAFGVSTTAGIEDIQLVMQVPSLMLPNVLYLVAES